MSIPIPLAWCTLPHSRQVTMISSLFLQKAKQALAWNLSSCGFLSLEVTFPPGIHVHDNPTRLLPGFSPKSPLGKAFPQDPI